MAAAMRRCSTKNCALLFIFLFLTGLLSFLENILPSSSSVVYDEEKSPEKLVRQSGGDGTPNKTQDVDEIRKDLPQNIVEVDVEQYLASGENFDVTECSTPIPEENYTTPKEVPLIALASYPRSGNKLTRQNLYRITGNNRRLYKQAHNLDLNETEFDRICYKTHAYDNETIKYYNGGAILLLRNPRESTISFFMWQYNERMKYDRDTVTDWIRKNDTIWTGWVQETIRSWRDTYLAWINQGHRVLISFTEDIAKDANRELSRMVAFAGQRVPIKLLKCTTSEFAWISRKHLDFEPFFPNDLLQQCISDVNNTLIRKGVRPLPTYPATYL
ncbi:WSC domain-containing protein 2 [Holothuria leucospilota]|uniref:WSC domain-containing protein 2 n=1 Tax=Holothuria leucospilota TaxID=206669 RepID=A0A9Q0YJ71_HOLLE|nr:WSC domain-containing protein 2 [Holothuria leucospilota]